MTVKRARMLGLARLADAVPSHHASATRQALAVAARSFKWLAMASAIVTKLPLNMLTPAAFLNHQPKDAPHPRNSTRTTGKVAWRTVRQWRQDFDSALGAGGPLNSDSIVTATWSPMPRLAPATGMPAEMPKSDLRRTPCAEKPTRAWGSMG